MNTLLSTVRSATLHGSIALGALGLVVLAQTVITSLDDVAVDGDTLSAEWVNEVNTLDERIETNEAEIAALQSTSNGSSPAGAVMAFYLTTCPTGWKPADGTNNTPDLRGVFVRGMENFGGQSSTRDPDRRGTNTLGSYQVHAIENITGDFLLWNAAFPKAANGAFGTSSKRTNVHGGGNFQYASWNHTDFNASRVVSTSSETRPKNVALLFCVKQ